MGVFLYPAFDSAKNMFTSSFCARGVTPVKGMYKATWASRPSRHAGDSSGYSATVPTGTDLPRIGWTCTDYQTEAHADDAAC